MDAGWRQTLRTTLKWCWAACLFCTGTLGRIRRRIAREGGVIVLTFHRVLPDADYEQSYSPRGMLVREQTFDAIARYTARQCKPAKLAASPLELLHKSGRKPQLAFTFDDGWADNGHYAMPIARSNGIPVTIFLCCERMGESFPFWPERVFAVCQAAERKGDLARVVRFLAERHDVFPKEMPTHDARELAQALTAWLKTLPVRHCERAVAELVDRFGPLPAEPQVTARESTMTWEEAQRLADEGTTFGSHTSSHVILPQLVPAEARQEVEASKRTLRQRLNRPCTTFSYPNGSWSREIRALVEEAGYSLALHNDCGIWSRGSDPYLVPRVNVCEGTAVGPSGRFSRLIFEYNVFWKADRATRRSEKVN